MNGGSRFGHRPPNETFLELQCILGTRFDLEPGDTVSDTRDTPVTYSRDEAQRIRAIVSDASRALECPLCQGKLKIGYPIAGGGTVHPVWEVRCQDCHRAAYATEIADQHRPSS